MKLLGLSGGLNQATNITIEKALNFAYEYDNSIEVEAFNAAEHNIQNCDGRDPSKYEGDAKLVIDIITEADALIIGTPMYRGSYTGVLKNVFDIIPNDALMGKPIGLIATGGSTHHYLALEHELKPLLGFFHALVIPGYVYASSEHFSKNDLVSEDILEQLNDLAISIVEFAKMLPSDTSRIIGPSGPHMYRTDTSTLLAFDENSNKSLFQALNSNYFIQDDNNQSIKVLDMHEAEYVWKSMPKKNITNIDEAFPKHHGGLGMSTDTIYDDNDEQEDNVEEKEELKDKF